MGCFSRHPLVGPSSAQKPYHNFSSLMFPAIWSTNLINACSSVALTVIFILYVHGSKSLYHIVGAPIWATNAPLLCDSRSKRSRWLFDRGSNSIRVETDDLPLLFGSWPLIDRDSDRNPMFIVFRKFVGLGFLLVLTSCAQNSEVGLKTRHGEMSTPSFFNLNAPFICLRPSIHCFLQPVLSKRSSMEGFWKARMYAAIAENQVLFGALQVERS